MPALRLPVDLWSKNPSLQLVASAGHRRASPLGPSWLKDEVHIGISAGSAYMISQLMQVINTTFIPVGHWWQCAFDLCPKRQTHSTGSVCVIKPNVIQLRCSCLILPKAHRETREFWKMTDKRETEMKAFIRTWHMHESRSIFFSRWRPFLTSLES